MSSNPEKGAPKWHHPSEVMKLHKLKMRKKALQARITGNTLKDTRNLPDALNGSFESVLTAKKRKNPFLKDFDQKRLKDDLNLTAPNLDESTDQTLFKLLNQSGSSLVGAPATVTSFENILEKVKDTDTVVVKEQGEVNLPLDWTLKQKIRLWSSQPFQWNQKLKVSEEASGTTSFVRCLDTDSVTNLDTAPNAKFHQCCLYWQQPSLPWLRLFPRTSGKVTETGVSLAANSTVKTSLQAAWSDSFRSLYQLIRTQQCPYFYLCANTFTVLFRASGICGFGDIHALVTPTTRGFRQLLKQEDIEFHMPLKRKRNSDLGYETLDSVVGDEEMGSAEPEVAAEEDEGPEEVWMKSIGIGANEIKQINYTQEKLVQKTECAVDNSEQSLILVEGVEVHAFFNFLLNCKSATPSTGPLAGVPPTLLAPVAFNGATLNSLKVRETKVHVDNTNYFSIELAGPILPSTIHNLFSINSPEHSISATFVNLNATSPFSKVVREKCSNDSERLMQGTAIFNKENLSDCGLNCRILEQFCSPNKAVASVECLKYNSDSKTYTWT